MKGRSALTLTQALAIGLCIAGADTARAGDGRTGSPARVISLDGQRELQQAAGGEETALPAGVPGCVQTDLHAFGLIPDPFVLTNERQLQGIEDATWIYRRSFTVPAGLCRALIRSPRDHALHARLLKQYRSCDEHDLRARLGVLYCVGARLLDRERSAAGVRRELRREYPFHADIRYLSPRYLAGICLACDGTGTIADRSGQSARCVRCSARGWIPSRDQERHVFLMLARRLAYGRMQLAPRPQSSFRGCLDQMEARLIAGDRAPAGEGAAAAVTPLTEFARTRRFALQCRLQGVAVEGPAVVRLRVDPFDAAHDFAARGRKAACLIPRWLRVRMPAARARDLRPGTVVRVVGTPRFYPGRLATTDPGEDQQFLLALRRRGGSAVIGTFTSVRYCVRLGPRWYRDPY